MPELPEVETIVRGLRRPLTGRIIEDLRCAWPPIVLGDLEEFRRSVVGRRITGVRRYGKYLFLILEDRGMIAVHLRMTGQLILSGPPKAGPAGRGLDAAPARDPHVHLELTFRDDPCRLIYRDPRKFGRLQWIAADGPDGPRAFARRKGLGEDALRLSSAGLERICRRTARGLKALLLDQSHIAGVGNIYADEILFRCRLSPLRSSRELNRQEILQLHRTLGRVLRASVDRRGTTISDFVGARGEPGGFQIALQVYGREGEACLGCGALIQRKRIAGRSTHFCPACQR
jgi:formamidopyrimidine-DNA glycosylase